MMKWPSICGHCGSGRVPDRHECPECGARPVSPCAFVFRGEECGYTGQSTDCNKTVRRCRELKNFVRFGGMPGVPLAAESMSAAHESASALEAILYWLREYNTSRECAFSMDAYRDKAELVAKIMKSLDDRKSAGSGGRE